MYFIIIEFNFIGQNQLLFYANLNHCRQDQLDTHVKKHLYKHANNILFRTQTIGACTSRLQVESIGWR